jgi:hypothetical protein
MREPTHEAEDKRAAHARNLPQVRTDMGAKKGGTMKIKVYCHECRHELSASCDENEDNSGFYRIGIWVSPCEYCMETAEERGRKQQSEEEA